MWHWQCSGGVLGVEPSPAETEVLGLIPGIEINFFTIFGCSHRFNTYFLRHSPSTSGLSIFSLSFTTCFFNTYHSFLFLLSYSSGWRLQKVKKYPCSFSALYLRDTVGANGIIKFLLCGSVNRRRRLLKVATNLIFCRKKPSRFEPLTSWLGSSGDDTQPTI